MDKITWEDIKAKYPENREDMIEEREKQFVDDCFSCYEKEGFSKKFWTPYDQFRGRIGQSVEVMGRCTTDDQDLCTLPAWKVKFDDGTIIGVYPEEIIVSEMRQNGCTLEGIE